jgi:hypothetical protein
MDEAPAYLLSGKEEGFRGEKVSGLINHLNLRRLQLYIFLADSSQRNAGIAMRRIILKINR